MSNDLTKVILDLQTRLAKLEAGARTSQLQHASLTGTAITVYDEDGETPLQYIGKQGDGTVGTVAVNGPVPPAPSLPTLTPGQLSLTVSWDGTFVDADGDPVPRPTDVEGVQVHVSDTSAFEPSSATLRGVLSVAGDLVVQPLAIEPKYVVLVAISSSKVVSEPSAEATGTPEQVVATDIVDGIVTTLKLADDAVTNAKIAGQAVDANKLADGSVDASKVVAGAIGTIQLADGSVDASKVVGDSIGANALQTDAVIAGKIAADAVGADQIIAGAIVAGKIAADAVGTDELAADSVVAGKIAAGEVNATHLAAQSVTTAALQSLAVTSDKIAANAITAGKIDAGAVTAETLAANAVTAAAIATGALDAQDIHAGTLTLDADSGNLLIYSGEARFGNLFISLSPDGGIDQFGNAFPAGIRVFNNGDITGADIILNPSAGTLWAYKQ